MAPGWRVAVLLIATAAVAKPGVYDTPLHALFFPRLTVAAGASQSIHHDLPDLNGMTADEVYETWTSLSNASYDRTPHLVDHGMQPMESIWQNHARSERLGSAFVEALAEVLRRWKWEAHLAGLSAVRRAVWQRDLMLMRDTVALIASNTEQWGGGAGAAQVRQQCMAIEQVLFEGLRRSLLTPEEVVQLRADCRSKLPPSIAAEVVEAMDGKGGRWYRFPVPAVANVHFQTFGRRSFSRTYIRAPALLVPELQAVHVALASTFAKRLNVTNRSDTLKLPAGTTTLLVRTAGVYTTSGMFVDSGLFEEILTREFLSRDAKVTADSTDLRGTRYRQWRMHRDLADTVLLKEIGPDDLTFPGFLTDVPGPLNTTGGVLTRMRFNCEACHMTTAFGTNSIFSLQSYGGSGSGSDEEMAEERMRHDPFYRLLRAER